MVAVHAGKRSIISMRGFEHDWPLFMWESPDGSRIPTFMIPGGYANGFRALEPHSKLIVFSNFTVEESSSDDYRFSKELWFNWIN